MTQPEIKVVGETRELAQDHWTCSAYGGSMSDPVEVVVEGDSEDDVKAQFPAAWNAAAGTSWTDDQFEYTRNWGREGDESPGTGT